MRIGIIGAGTVGLALARGLDAKGNSVTLGTRDTEKPEVRAWLAAVVGDSQVASYRDAVASAELVITAVPGRLVVEVVQEIGVAAFQDKLLIDVSNPVVFDDAGAHSAFGDEDSAAEALQRTLPSARVVKAFNQIEAAKMTDPPPDEERPMRIAGDDEDAKVEVTALLESLGWTVRDLGPLKRSRALERGVIKWLAEQS